MRRLHVVRA